MSRQLQILVIAASLFLLTITLELVRRGRLRERYSLLLLMGPGSALVLAIFAGTLSKIALTLGIGYGPSLAFSAATVGLFAIQVAQGVIVSSLSVRNRDLAQKVAELEWHISQLCQRAHETEESLDVAWPEATQREPIGIRSNCAIEK
jgi:hypothetical protein